MDVESSKYKNSVLNRDDTQLTDSTQSTEQQVQDHAASINAVRCHNNINSDEELLLSTPTDAEKAYLKDVKMQSVVFIEDAVQYRSIHHKASKFSLTLYRWYRSASIQYVIKLATFIILMLAFIEEPSSLSWSSDPRRNCKRFELPHGITEGIEILCLVILTVSNIIQGYLSTHKESQVPFLKRNPWLTGGFIVLLLSFADVIVSLVLGNDSYRIRIRRLFRPYFLVQNTTMLKKTLKAMWNTLPEIASVLTLLSLHLYFFTMLGMLVFPHRTANSTAINGDEFNNTEWKLYFRTIDNAIMSLLVLLTTANNPDVMMPAYSENRLYAIYFILFSLIGTFLVFNLLTAIIYNQFRGYFKCSMQTSYFRRCVALSAAHHSLCKATAVVKGQNYMELDQPLASVCIIQEVLRKASLSPEQRRHVYTALKEACDNGLTELNLDLFNNLFRNIDSSFHLSILPKAQVPVWTSKVMKFIQKLVQNRYFDVAGNFVVLLNAILMTVEIAIHYEEAFKGVFSRLNIMNYVFVGYYFIEQTLKMLSLGKKYFVNINCLYDGAITVALVVIELVQLSKYGHSSPASVRGLSLWDCARIVNILVLLRLLRIIPHFRPMALVTGVLLDIIRSLKSFAGIIIIIYYTFAIMGMIVFENAISPPPGLPFPKANSALTTMPPPPEYECGTYQQLQYWANNFNDFASSVVVLWDVMVVNNWGVFLQAYKAEVNSWSQLFFVIWWLISSVVCVNLFVALILDHFIAKWEGDSRERTENHRGTIQSLFQNHLHQPSQERIQKELRKHPCLQSDVTC
ncbi:unnamed protein product [Clavelina lepadiformis]|uniref:Ion transport domain-containing protein n=1 Tax=Clavelina lepadiformis TaxID=159417 RepID=A0ABP0F9Z6_CLALP